MANGFDMKIHASIPNRLDILTGEHPVCLVRNQVAIHAAAATADLCKRLIRITRFSVSTSPTDVDDFSDTFRICCDV